MRKLALFSTLFFILLLWGCAKEVPEPQTQIPSESQKAIQKAEARIAAAELELQDDVTESRSGDAVVVPAGSVDALAAAIEQAGENGKVVLASGDHYESKTVLISHQVSIIGEKGAVLHSDVGPDGWVHDPALYIKDASKVKIKGLEIRPQEPRGNTGILVRNGHEVRIEGNKIIGFGWGIFLAGADNSKIIKNYIEGIVTGSWWGIVNLEGKNAYIKGNTATKYWAGIFCSDKNGIAYKNKTYDNDAGIFMCKARWTSLPDGTPVAAPEACNEWVILGNDSYNNVSGYRGQDGANNNWLFQNSASAGNSRNDIELLGEFTDGILFPTTFENVVISIGRYKNLLVKNCVESNEIIGGQMVDYEEDPCP
ncbi:MAG: hypothetical protein GY705_29615 [Bacteroidetes bacterium]|nr:hypothetical protein [Bacteroidota bacterium]